MFDYLVRDVRYQITDDYVRYRWLRVGEGKGLDTE